MQSFLPKHGYRSIFHLTVTADGAAGIKEEVLQ